MTILVEPWMVICVVLAVVVGALFGLYCLLSITAAADQYDEDPPPFVRRS